MRHVGTAVPTTSYKHFFPIFIRWSYHYEETVTVISQGPHFIPVVPYGRMHGMDWITTKGVQISHVDMELFDEGLYQKLQKMVHFVFN